MLNRNNCLCILLILFSTMVSADDHLEFPNEGSISDIYLLSVRRNEGSTVGEGSSYTTLEALSFPYNYKKLYSFIDLRLHGFGESCQNAYNAGIGFRYTPNFTSAALGANVYYDYRRSYHREFNQIGVGFEYLGTCLNFRCNGYLPVGNKSSLRSSKYCARYPGGYFLIREKYVDSLKGVDFEAEMLVKRVCCIDVYFAIGGYYYKRRICGRNILGSEYRLTLNPNSCWNFGVKVTNDCHYKTRVQAELTFTLPFRCKGCASSCSPLFQPIRRQEMIVLDKHDMYIWNW